MLVKKDLGGLVVALFVGLVARGFDGQRQLAGSQGKSLELG